jgi:hypothetical protein
MPEPVRSQPTLRQSKKVRLWVIGALIAVAVFLLFVVKSTWAKVAIGAVIAILATAFGMEATNNDYDLNTLAKTRSFEAAKIQRDADGNLTGVTEFCASEKIDYNCDDFKTQAEAMEVYDRCSAAGKDMDEFRLDGDNDGRVCESLPAGAR